MTSPARAARLTVLVLASALLAGCSLFEKSGPDIEDMTARQIYDRGEAQLADDEPLLAAQTFDEVERLYPFSQLAKRATIMAAYSYYEAEDVSSARAAAKRYLDLYPSDVDAPYAQYLIALTYYDNIVDVGRDQATTKAALRELNEVVQRYPDSDYARDAKLKIDLTRNHLAGKEMTVGRYYLKRGHYVSATNRFRVVIEDYQTTSHTPEALHRLVEAYLSMGLDQEAQIAAAVLGRNFPGSDWYVDSYRLLAGRDLAPAREEDGFFSEVYRRVFKGEWL